MIAITAVLVLAAVATAVADLRLLAEAKAAIPPLPAAPNPLAAAPAASPSSATSPPASAGAAPRRRPPPRAEQTPAHGRSDGGRRDAR